MYAARHLRALLVSVTIEWERRFGVAPHVTSAISEFDASVIVGQSPEEFGRMRQGQTAVQAGYDFVHKAVRYQVKANRPSGKHGSTVTLVGKAKSPEWDRLVWVLYDKFYQVAEAWQWDKAAYERAFASKKRIAPEDLRKGKKLRVPKWLSRPANTQFDSSASDQHIHK